MSRSQRNRRRRGRGRPRNKALLAMMVVLVLVALAGLSAVGYVISIASSAPPLDSLKPRELGSQSEVRAADGTRLGFIQSNELRQPVSGAKIPKYAQGRHGGDRGRALLPPQGRRLRGRRARRGQEPLEPQDRAGRLHDHDAADPQPLHHEGADVPAQDPRGQAGRGARERASRRPGQGLDPRQVPQHRAVRHARRPDRRRRAGRLARLLRQAGPEAEAQPGRAAGRAAAGADHLLAGPRAREGRGPPQRGAGQDGRARDDQPGRPR